MGWKLAGLVRSSTAELLPTNLTAASFHSAWWDHSLGPTISEQVEEGLTKGGALFEYSVLNLVVRGEAGCGFGVFDGSLQLTSVNLITG